MTSDEWAVQTTIKHGPVMNDRGDRLLMTNMRGFTVRSVLDHIEDYAGNVDRFNQAVDKILASEAIQTHFPAAATPQPQQQYAPAASSLRARDGEWCKPHQLPMRYKSGVSSKGNPYELLECTAPKERNPCDTIWPDRG